MVTRLPSFVAIGVLALLVAAPMAPSSQRTRLSISIEGLCSGGDITFEIHHGEEVVRVQPTLHFFEPPTITVLDVANALRRAVPPGWKVVAGFDTLVVSLPPDVRHHDTRVSEGKAPSPPSASLRSPQVIRGQTWTQVVRRSKVRRR